MSTTIPAPGAHAPLLAPGPLELKYLFCAQFADGSIFEQTPEDVSPFTPGRNAFYELLECEPDGSPKQHPLDGRLITRDDINLFQLEDDQHRYLVDLRDGHFEIQHRKGKQWIGAHFRLGFPDGPIRLFYFRRRRHHANIKGTVLDDMTVKEELLSQSQECEYHFGWELEDHTIRGEMILV